MQQNLSIRHPPPTVNSTCSPTPAARLQQLINAPAMFVQGAPAAQQQPPRRIKRRANYEEIRRFPTTRQFNEWWAEESKNWRVNSRHPHMRGTVEYWRCGFLQGRRYTCLARLRVSLAYDDRWCVVSRSVDHPHIHSAVAQVPMDPSAVQIAEQLSPYPVHTAQLIDLPSLTLPNMKSGAPDEDGQPPQGM